MNVLVASLVAFESDSFRDEKTGDFVKDLLNEGWKIHTHIWMEAAIPSPHDKRLNSVEP
jgi:hypothetical protein